MTLTTFILATISGKSGLRQQAIVHDTLGADGPADFRSILKLVFIFTLSVEFTGTLVLWIRFLFESIHGRCMACSFSRRLRLLQRRISLNDDNLMRYKGDFLVNISNLHVDRFGRHRLSGRQRSMAMRAKQETSDLGHVARSHQDYSLGNGHPVGRWNVWILGFGVGWDPSRSNVE